MTMVRIEAINVTRAAYENLKVAAATRHLEPRDLVEGVIQILGEDPVLLRNVIDDDLDDAGEPV